MRWFKEIWHGDVQFLISIGENESYFLVIMEFYKNEQFYTVSWEFETPEDRLKWFESITEQHCKEVMLSSDLNMN